MKQFLRSIIAAVALSTSILAGAVQPDRPRVQSYKLNDDGSIDFEVKMPTKTDYDEWYIQYDLTHIDQAIVERRDKGGDYYSYITVATAENPDVGSTITLTDKNTEVGKTYEYKFSVIVDNEKGQSEFREITTVAVPGQILDLEANVDLSTPAVTLTLTAPATDASGAPLTSLTSVVIERSSSMFDTKDIKTFSPVSPGEALTFVDTDVETGGHYYYRAYAINGINCNGQRTDELPVYLAEDIPATPANLVATVTDGKQVSLTWEAPTTGYNGGIFDPENVEYGIYRRYWDTEEYALVKGGVKGTSFVDDTEFPEEALVQYTLIAVNAAGECPMQIYSNQVLVGDPAKFPFAESFTDSELDHKGWTFTTTYQDPYYTPTTWTLHQSKSMFYWPTDETLNIEPADSDYGMAVAYFYDYQEAGTTHSLMSPRIDLTGAKAPQLTFHYFETCREATENIIRVLAKADSDSEWETVYESEIRDNIAPNWHKVTVDMPQFAGKNWINLRFDAVRGGLNIVDMCLDAITLAEKPEAGIVTIGEDQDNGITSSSEVPQYYNLQGMRVIAPANGDILIEKTSSQTRKIIFGR